MKTDNFPKNFHYLHKAEESIRAQNIEHINANETLLFHVSTIEKSMDIINYFYSQYESENEEQKILQVLGVQIFNQSASSLKLILSGYYHAAASIKRSLLETVFLLDYFSTDKTLISEWHKSDKKIRTRGKFSPFSVRVALDERDSFNEKKRKQHYERLSELGTHTTPDSFMMLNPIPGADYYYGPFFSPEMIKGSIEELVMVSLQAAEKFFQFSEPKKLIDYQMKVLFAEGCNRWSHRFYKTTPFDQSLIDELKEMMKLAEQPE
jgi:hypothetical protein